MLKEIIKTAKVNGIVYREGYFKYKDSNVSFNDFMKYINHKKFINGLSEAIELSKSELFNKNK